MTTPKEEAAEPVAWARQRSLERLEEHGMIIAICGPGPDGGYTEPLYSQAYVLSLRQQLAEARAKALEEVVAEARGFWKGSDPRDYMRGWNACCVAISNHLEDLWAAAVSGTSTLTHEADTKPHTPAE